MGKEATLRAIQKKFYGTDEDGSDRWFVVGEVIDLSQVDWPNAFSLQRARYLRTLEYGEDPVASGDGRRWINDVLAARHPGSQPTGDRASSPGVVDSDPDAAGSAPVAPSVPGAPVVPSAGDTSPPSVNDSSDDEGVGAGDHEGGEDADAVDGGSNDTTEPDPSAEPKEPAYELEGIGGGWYHVVVSGERKSQSPMRKADVGAWVAENLKE